MSLISDLMSLMSHSQDVSQLFIVRIRKLKLKKNLKQSCMPMLQLQESKTQLHVFIFANIVSAIYQCRYKVYCPSWAIVSRLLQMRVVVGVDLVAAVVGDALTRREVSQVSLLIITYASAICRFCKSLKLGLETNVCSCHQTQIFKF